jgi:hypothetical protein
MNLFLKLLSEDGKVTSTPFTLPGRIIIYVRKVLGSSACSQAG